MIAGLNQFVLGCLFAAGCSTPTAERGSAPAVVVVVGTDHKGVLLSASAAERNPYLARLFAGFWNPTPQQTAEAEKAIRIFLATADAGKSVDEYSRSQIPLIRARLSEYRRQYVGVMAAHEQRILCSMLTPDRSKFSDWRKRFVDLVEGAPDCWRIEYVIPTQQCTNFTASFGY